MSLLIVCAVYDRAVESYGRPIFVPAAGAAVRSFRDEVNRNAPDNQLYLHPDDFDLYELCGFDEERGEFVPREGGKVVLLRGKDAKENLV